MKHSSGFGVGTVALRLTWQRHRPMAEAAVRLDKGIGLPWRLPNSCRELAFYYRLIGSVRAMKGS